VGHRRYRYYVSRSLIKSPVDQIKDGWRLAAPTIERAVMAAAAQTLEDRSAIGALLHYPGLSAQNLPRALKSIDGYRVHLQSGDITAATAAAINRIDLSKDKPSIGIDLARLIADQPEHRNGGRITKTRSAALQLERRGGELRIVMAEEGTAPTEIDLALLKANARGPCGFTALASNQVNDPLEMAKREGLRDSYVRRVTLLAFLAQSIVEAICAGRHPVDLTTERLTRRRILRHFMRTQRQIVV